MKYICANYHYPSYIIRDEVEPHERSFYSKIVPMPDRPKSGQFWRNKESGEVVYVSSVYHMTPKHDGKYISYRGVSIIHTEGRCKTGYLGGYEIYALNFVRDHTLVTDRETIMANLARLIALCPTAKKAKNILRLKTLNLSEEEKGILVLRSLDD